MGTLRLRNVFVVLLLALSITPLASAQQGELLVGCLGEYGSGSFNAAPNVKLAQGFVLANRSYITSIQVDQFRCYAEECAFHLTDAITLGEGIGRIFATMPFIFSDNGYHILQVNRMLDPGSYYLVAVTTKETPGTSGIAPTFSSGGRVQAYGNTVGLNHLTNFGSYKGRWETWYWVEPQVSLLFRVYGLQPISLDITPSGDCKTINPGVGSLSVTILSSNEFDAATVDPATIRFGSTGTEAAPFSKAKMKDADCDGTTDMVLLFRVYETGIKCGDTTATLKANTFAGKEVVGTGSIKTVPCQ